MILPITQNQQPYGRKQSPEYSKTPRHVPCVQEDYNEGGKQKFVHYFSDLHLRKTEGKLPVFIPLLTILCFKHNAFQTNDDVKHVKNKAEQFRIDMTGIPLRLAHSGTISIAKRRLSTKKSPPFKSN